MRTITAALALWASATTAEAAPRRVVSLNPCVDGILMEVADPAQIAAISHYSQNPRSSSVPLVQARRFRVTWDTAEEVVALRPDLVIAGRHVALATRNALARMHIPILFFEVPQSVEDSAIQVRRIADALGQSERGRRLNARIDAALAAAAPRDVRRVPALIWQGSGLVPGRGTLADELLRRTGFTNASATYGLKQWDMLPLEYMVARPPAVIFTALAVSNREGTMRARALGRIARQARMVDYPETLLYCAGPVLIEATARMAAARRALLAQQAVGR